MSLVLVPWLPAKFTRSSCQCVWLLLDLWLNLLILSHLSICLASTSYLLMWLEMVHASTNLLHTPVHSLTINASTFQDFLIHLKLPLSFSLPLLSYCLMSGMILATTLQTNMPNIFTMVYFSFCRIAVVRWLI